MLCADTKPMSMLGWGLPSTHSLYRRGCGRVTLPHTLHNPPTLHPTTTITPLLPTG